MKKQSLIAILATVLGICAHAQSNSLIDKVKNSGVIVMGVRDSAGALSYTLGDGRYAGFHVELCQRIITDLQRQIGKNIEIKYQSVTAQNRIPLLQNGSIDMECGATTNNATRQKDVAFLTTTFVEEVRMAVKTSSGISSIAQLSNRSVATTTGSTGVQQLRKHERSLNVDFKELYGKDSADSFLLLESGRAEALVTDAQILAGLIATSKTPADFSIVGEVLNVEPIAIMVRKDDAAFKVLANSVILQQVKSGEINRLWNKWFMEPIAPKGVNLKLATSESTKAAWSNPNERPMEEYIKK